MEFIPPLMLSVFSFLLITYTFKKIEKIFFKKNKYRQSDVHKIFKKYPNSLPTKKQKTSQMLERLDKSSLNVVVWEDKAYWVVNNIFYSANFLNGQVDTETIKPIDTDGLSRKDLDQMLLILDKLGDGNNDSRSSG